MHLAVLLHVLYDTIAIILAFCAIFCHLFQFVRVAEIEKTIKNIFRFLEIR